jgi:predicted CoA-binding protein
MTQVLEIRDGLTTAMSYAVVSSTSDFGLPEKQHGRDTHFWGMLKPPYEAYKTVEVMRSWGAVVYPVDLHAETQTVAGKRCYPSLKSIPDPIDCAILSVHPRHRHTVLEQVIDAKIKTVWLQYSLMKAGLAEVFLQHGLRVIEGCVLVHWDVDHVRGFDKGRNICHIHGVLAKAWRIKVCAGGQLERLPPQDIKRMNWSRETFGAKLINPNYPEIEVLK